MKNKSSKALLGTSILTSIAASLCCITPILALIAGGSGIASSFSWLEPLRPYLIGFTILVISFAWYQKLKPQEKELVECDCEEDKKQSFLQTKAFLGIVTIFAALMLTVPYYSKVFTPEKSTSFVIENQENIQWLNLEIEGMTCDACNLHVTHAAKKINGVATATADYKTGKAEIKYDKTKTKKEEIVAAINKSGYRVK